MGEPGEADLAHVEHPFEPAEIDEGAVGRQRRDLAPHYGADLDLRARFSSPLLLLFLQDGPARQDDVRARAAVLELAHLEGQVLAHELRWVFDVAQVELGERTERP